MVIGEINNICSDPTAYLVKVELQDPFLVGVHTTDTLPQRPSLKCIILFLHFAFQLRKLPVFQLD